MYHLRRDRRAQLAFRLDPDVLEQVDDFAREHDITRSEAVRLLIRRGLAEANVGLVLAPLRTKAS
jgi:predicted transcriptional regulator